MRKHAFPTIVVILLLVICYILTRIENHLYALRRSADNTESIQYTILGDLTKPTESIESLLRGMADQLSDIEEAVRENR